MYYFQDVIAALSSFWAKRGCVVISPYDLEKGAGTSNPATLLRALGPEPFSTAYIEPCRRPKDGRYGMNPNRLQHYFQYQVILKPSPDNIVELYLESLHAIGLETEKHDIRFVHDDWENPTLGAWGLGWEVWLNGMEVTQFTFFQAAAGIPLHPITGEITYGIERLTMCLQNVSSIYDIQWNEHITYGDLYHQNEVQWSCYNFEKQDEKMWARHFADYQVEAKRLVSLHLPIPAYDFVLKASHAFNMLDAKGVISVSDRAAYIGKIRDLTKTVADGYLQFREELGFPLCKKTPEKKESPPLLPLPNPKNQAERFLLEIGVEELPAAIIPQAIQTFQSAIKKLLDKEKISYSSIISYASPRRLSVIVEDMATSRKEEQTIKKGPPLASIWDEMGVLSKTGEGFFKSINMLPCSKEELLSGKIPFLEAKEIKKDLYIFVTEQTSSLTTAKILQEKIPYLISSLEFPKSMRWNDHALKFIRPIRHIVCLLGEDIVPFMVEHIQSNRISFGHRQRKPNGITIPNAREYEALLKNSFVIVDPLERESRIVKALKDIENETGYQCIEKERMVHETTFLSEYPEPALACFDRSLLNAPKEILSSEMIEHQKYIPLVDKDGNLTNHFILVADNTPSETVKKGNVTVLTARLRDGSFLWNEDLKISLQDLREKLKVVSFQEGLGNLFEKTERMASLAEKLCAFFPKESKEDAKMAAQLSKADLVSQVVCEFPHLQGCIGSYLAKEQHLSDAVAKALEEQYLPKQEDGKVPSTHLSSIIALSDKIDTLAGFFARNLKPTSSNDPFALRRAAIGIIRILLHEKVHINIFDIFSKALSSYGSLLKDISIENVAKELTVYMQSRLKPYLSEQALSKELLDAVISPETVDLYDGYLRAQALSSIQNSVTCSEFLEVLRRCVGQVEENFDAKVRKDLLKEPAEIVLFDAIQKVTQETEKALSSSDYAAYLESLLQLKKPLSSLFDSVRILDEDLSLRQNRLSLLALIIRLSSRFANAKKLLEILPSQKKQAS